MLRWRVRTSGARRSRFHPDHAVDRIRDRFGWDAIGYGSALGISPSVPDEFRKLAENDL
jgi:DNA polymerase-4